MASVQNDLFLLLILCYIHIDVWYNIMTNNKPSKIYVWSNFLHFFARSQIIGHNYVIYMQHT